ncbi:saccharopine dehydrogenase NADP-binding domain-containing protein [Paenibacillus profundus]|uniref:Saccharopine dehydrogenase NADP-binding domain-containing protein n=1 Tax=Paenibacillus profundus TaxID=1173085 RepID=A0ABS8YMQ8_9BACL|nr:saccharopine dehydrogenase NADP-binding domain-containing protein [Paenibacillus profundus]MCE5171600.1 saccharopine dehydrogenase NADP-binding domain-containing protein [Paenibacillus profundus]
MKDNIVVVGGYGHVGKMICKELGDLYPGKVYAAGRNVERAEQFCRSTSGKVKPLKLNVQEAADPNMLARAKLVIMCLDQSDTAFVRSCFNSGTHYVDVSANRAFLAQVEQRQEEAAANGATAILSVGLAPGLTNLMALQAQQLMDETKSIDISIMLGMGDQHGQAAIEWTVNNLNTSFEVIQDGRPITVASFTDGKHIDFGADWGRRAAYRFNFSDQQTLPRTLGVPTVSTRLCFDSAAVTALIAEARAAKMFSLLKVEWIRRAVVRSFGMMRIGEETFAVKIDARGCKAGEDAWVECFLHGKNEAEITARVAVFAANAVYGSSFPHGVYHMEQLFGPESLQAVTRGIADLEIRIDRRKQ